MKKGIIVTGKERRKEARTLEEGMMENESEQETRLQCERKDKRML